MRRLVFVAVIAVLAFLPFAVSGSAQAQTQAQVPTLVKSQDHRLLAAGAGAILGNLFFSMAGMTAGYPAGLPFVAAARAPVPVDFLYGSRIILTVSIGVGALAAHYLYTLTH
ncbi:membrane hypothetical protein [uncultured Gammaproteobacteria bacterium]